MHYYTERPSISLITFSQQRVAPGCRAEIRTRGPSLRQAGGADNLVNNVIFTILCLGSGGDSSGYSRTQSNFLPYGELFKVINRLHLTKEYSDATPKAFLSSPLSECCSLGLAIGGRSLS
jgi:hypothetical protein